MNSFCLSDIEPISSWFLCTGWNFIFYRPRIYRFTSWIDGVCIVNALDAVASRDYLLELASHFSTLGSTLSPWFAQDLYTWSSAECSYLSISDAYSCCSSIMPQKKNALSLEHIRSKTSHLTSSYMDILMCLKGTSFSSNSRSV